MVFYCVLDTLQNNKERGVHLAGKPLRLYALLLRLSIHLCTHSAGEAAADPQHSGGQRNGAVLFEFLLSFPSFCGGYPCLTQLCKGQKTLTLSDTVLS